MPERQADNAASRLGWRWHRIQGGWRCKIGIHRWRGHHDLGDGINVAPISGYRKPHGVRDWRVCTWCGAHAVVRRLGDDRTRILVWGEPMQADSAASRFGWLVCALIGHKPYGGTIYYADPPFTLTARYCLRCRCACEVRHA